MRYIYIYQRRRRHTHNTPQPFFYLSLPFLSFIYLEETYVLNVTYKHAPHRHEDTTYTQHTHKYIRCTYTYDAQTHTYIPLSDTFLSSQNPQCYKSNYERRCNTQASFNFSIKSAFFPDAEIPLSLHMARRSA